LLPTIRSRLIEVTFPPLTAAERASLRTSGARADASEDTAHDAAVAWFYAIVTGEEADAAGWATRATLTDGLDAVKSLTRDWLARRLSPDAPLLAPEHAARLDALPARDPAALARTLGALGDAERIATSNVSPALIADLAKMALIAGR
jgi:hypothetical protein